MARTGLQRLDAIIPAIERGESFEKRIPAAGTLIDYADLMAEAIAMAKDARMAEAIAMAQDARSLETVGRNGRKVMSVEELKAAHCMNVARISYLAAKERLAHGNQRRRTRGKFA